MSRKIGKLIVTMFGIGMVKYFPGTFASFVTASIYCFFYTIKLNYLLLILINFFFIIVFLSFIGFRFFDILKPYPINYVDKNMKNGFGVILDDLIAGFFTLIVLYICIIFYGQI